MHSLPSKNVKRRNTTKPMAKVKVKEEIEELDSKVAKRKDRKFQIVSNLKMFQFHRVRYTIPSRYCKSAYFCIN